MSSGPTNLDVLLRAVRRLELADIEYHRACQTQEQPRLNRAGTRYACAKIAVISAARNFPGYIRRAGPGGAAAG